MKYVEIEKPVEVEKIVERIVEKQADTAGSDVYKRQVEGYDCRRQCG